MPNEVVRSAGGYIDRRVDRQTAKAVRQVQNKGEENEARVAAVYQVANHAQMWSMMTHAIQRRAEMVSPDNTFAQAAIVDAADMAAVAIILSMGRR